MSASRLINSRSTLLCPHGGPVQIMATGFRSPLPDGSIPAKATDLFMIAGCPFIVGDRPSPCIRVQWVVTNTAELVENQPSLNAQSSGLCLGISGAPQGPVIIARV
jgi:hypothetical protein